MDEVMEYALKNNVIFSVEPFGDIITIKVKRRKPYQGGVYLGETYDANTRTFNRNKYLKSKIPLKNEIEIALLKLLKEEVRYQKRQKVLKEKKINDV